MCLDCFNVLLSKINLKKLKNIYYFNTFPIEKHFKTTVSNTYLKLTCRMNRALTLRT
jgi:hypothetical protein